MKIYFNRKSLPELSGLSDKEKIELLARIDPKPKEVLGFFIAIGLGYILGQELGMWLYRETSNKTLAAIIAGGILGGSIYAYDLGCMNLITRKQLKEIRGGNNVL